MENENESFEKFKKAISGSGYDEKLEGFITPDDEIEFDCKRCGKCCQHRDDPNEMIFVSPLDIYNGAKKLGITPEKFVDDYTNYHVGSTSGVIVMVLACNDNGDCKLLEFDENGLAKCKIHDSKPTICAIHPLGIVHSKKLDDKTEDKRYVVAMHCEESRTGKMIKASEIIDSVKGTEEEVEMAMEVRVGWIPGEQGISSILDTIMLHTILSTAICTPEEKKTYGISDKFFRIATNVKTAFEKAVGPVGIKNVDMVKMLKSASTPGYLYDTNLKTVYLNYDLDKPFLPQCEENLKTMQETINKIMEYKDLVYNEITAGLTDKQKEKIPEFLKYMNVIARL